MGKMMVMVSRKDIESGGVGKSACGLGSGQARAPLKSVDFSSVCENVHSCHLIYHILFVR